VLNVPCLTLRFNTERPVTVELGTVSWWGMTKCASAPLGSGSWTGSGNRRCRSHCGMATPPSGSPGACERCGLTQAPCPSPRPRKPAGFLDHRECERSLRCPIALMDSTYLRHRLHDVEGANQVAKPVGKPVGELELQDHRGVKLLCGSLISVLSSLVRNGSPPHRVHREAVVSSSLTYASRK